MVLRFSGTISKRRHLYGSRLADPLNTELPPHAKGTKKLFKSNLGEPLRLAVPPIMSAGQKGAPKEQKVTKS